MMVELTWFGTTVLSLLGLGAIGCCCPDQQQQQQITIAGDDEGPKRVCPECGMQNPREANHCGDCGYSFKPNDDE